MTSNTLVLGASGFLGSYFKYLKKQPLQQFRSNKEVIDNSSVYFDPFNFTELNKMIDYHKIRSVINCVALASIELCEKEPKVAFKINTDFPHNLAKFCYSNGVHLVHVSTDAVLEDNVVLKNELSPIALKSTYAESKFEGEKAVRGISPNFTIARVNFYGSSPKKNSLFDYFYESILSGTPTIGFYDSIFSPLYVLDSAEVLKLLADTKMPGVIHLGGSEILSKYDFGQEVAKALGASSDLIVRSSIKDFSMARLRSSNLGMDNSRMLDFFTPKYSLLQGIIDSIKRRKSEKN
jgi:dTDP-4-dehydrorhamnose reductase